MRKQFILSAAIIAIISALCLFIACEFNNPDAIDIPDPGKPVDPNNPGYTPKYPLLVINEWSDGGISLEVKEQWFEFTATAATQYIHFKKGTLDDIYIQLYNKKNEAVDTQKELYGSGADLYKSFSITNGQTYYIKVTPYGSRTGTYQIGFTASTASPDIIASANAAVQLNINEWSDGSFTLLEKEKWFKFSASAATQYIHLKPDTVNDVYVQLYNNSYVASDLPKELYGSGTNLYTSSPVTVGQLYYIKVTPYGSQTGNYKIGITGSAASPDMMAAMNSAVPLIINTWADGAISSVITEQWFTFTATAATHFIHFQIGSLDDIYVDLYNSSGVLVDSRKELYSGRLNTSSPVTIGQTYYIKVTPYSSRTGNYKLGYTTSATAPVN